MSDAMFEGITVDTTSPMEDLSTVAEPVAPPPQWLVIFDNVQLIFTAVGVLANLSTLITLIKNGDAFSDVICLLLKYQSVLDAIVCLFGFLLGLFPYFWSTDIWLLDAIICQLWHGTYLYWVSICWSIWNLVLLAVERYICICHPLKYHQLTKRKIKTVMAATFFIAFFMTCGAAFGTRMKGNTCVSEFFMDGIAFERFMAGFAFSTFFTFYTIPTALFITLYGLIINKFRNRAQASLGASGTASVIDKATSELTKTAIVVTFVFIVSFSWDLWYYTLGYMGLLDYVINSPTVKIGTFLALLNSVVNPFIYASLMPMYRHSIKKTFMPCMM